MEVFFRSLKGCRPQLISQAISWKRRVVRQAGRPLADRGPFYMQHQPRGDLMAGLLLEAGAPRSRNLAAQKEDVTQNKMHPHPGLCLAQKTTLLFFFH